MQAVLGNPVHHCVKCLYHQQHLAEWYHQLALSLTERVFSEYVAGAIGFQRPFESDLALAFVLPPLICIVRFSPSISTGAKTSIT
jgi:hypothetical protein